MINIVLVVMVNGAVCVWNEEDSEDRVSEEMVGRNVKRLRI